MMSGTLIRAFVFFFFGLLLILLDSLVDFLYFLFFIFEIRIIRQGFSSALHFTFAMVGLMIPSIPRIEFFIIELVLSLSISFVLNSKFQSP